MKKITLIMLLFISFAGAAQTTEKSKKGHWSEADKKLAQDAIRSVDADLNALGAKKQDFIDCYLYRLEQKYKSFDKANSDLSGCEKVAKKCVKELM